jgi:hypothetical protein
MNDLIRHVEKHKVLFHYTSTVQTVVRRYNDEANATPIFSHNSSRTTLLLLLKIRNWIGKTNEDDLLLYTRIMARNDKHEHEQQRIG